MSGKSSLTLNSGEEYYAESKRKRLLAWSRQPIDGPNITLTMQTDHEDDLEEKLVFKSSFKQPSVYFSGLYHQILSKVELGFHITRLEGFEVFNSLSFHKKLICARKVDWEAFMAFANARKIFGPTSPRKVCAQKPDSALFLIRLLQHAKSNSFNFDRSDDHVVGGKARVLKNLLLSTESGVRPGSDLFSFLVSHKEDLISMIKESFTQEDYNALLSKHVVEESLLHQVLWTARDTGFFATIFCRAHCSEDRGCLKKLKDQRDALFDFKR